MGAKKDSERDRQKSASRHADFLRSCQRTPGFRSGWLATARASIPTHPPSTGLGEAVLILLLVVAALQPEPGRPEACSILASKWIVSYSWIEASVVD